MLIYKYPGENRICGECVLAIGFFDGVHIAHRDLILTAKSEAQRLKLPLGIFTFSSGSDIKNDVARIYTDEEKTEIFESLGADFTVFADFAKIRDFSPEKFVSKILISSLKCRTCVVGFNFRFGKGAAGNAEMLSVLMRGSGGEAIIKSEITDKDGKAVSSTRIREHIVRGEMQKAQELLGIPYYIKGRVEHGNSTGRKLGFPTVNLPIPKDKVVARLGVYRSAVAIGDKIYTGLTNVGICPTFEARSVHQETYILDFDGDIYGREITVYLIGFMRDEIAFSSPEELKMQINVDKNRAIKENGDITWQELGLK